MCGLSVACVEVPGAKADGKRLSEKAVTIIMGSSKHICLPSHPALLVPAGPAQGLNRIRFCITKWASTYCACESTPMRLSQLCWLLRTNGSVRSYWLSTNPASPCFTKEAAMLPNSPHVSNTRSQTIVDTHAWTQLANMDCLHSHAPNMDCTWQGDLAGGVFPPLT